MTLPLQPPHYINFFEPFHFFTAGDQLVVPIGVTHISLLLHQIQSREQEKKEQTNKHLGLTQVKKGELCNTAYPVYMCRLTLVWISSETSTKQLECRFILTRSSFTGLDPLSCRLASLLRCPVSTASLCPPSPTPFSRPLTTPGHVEIAGPKPFVWFRTKTDKGIVCLADHLHSVTVEPFDFPFSIFMTIYFNIRVISSYFILIQIIIINNILEVLVV